MLSIQNVRGHYQVYRDGKFLFSADSETEVWEELEDYEQLQTAACL